MRLSEIRRQLTLRNEQLKRLSEYLKSKLSDAPAENLAVGSSHGKPRYYSRNAKSRKLVYLSKEKTAELKALQQKEYNSNLLKTALNGQKAIEKALKTLDKCKDPEQIFLETEKERTTLIEPFGRIEDGKGSWMLGKVPRKYISPDSPYVTNAGERVRSKSELIIANKLFDKGIKYQYEMNTSLDGEIAGNNPDFTVLNGRTGMVYIWEHFGMIDKPEYAKDTVVKLDNYRKYGYLPGKNLIITFESSVTPLSTEAIDSVIKEYLL